MNTTKLLKTIIPALLTALLCGCPTMHTHYLAQPEPLVVRGEYVHPASKITMPVSVAGFQRDMILRYDADGYDISAGYNFFSPSCTIAATVYVYPAPSLISIGSPPDVVADARAHLTEGEFERRKDEIVHAHPGAVLIDQNDIVQTEDGQSYPGKFAIFEYKDIFGGLRIPLSSRLYVFCFVGKRWAIEYRFSYPKGADADKKIQEFIQQWIWYGSGLTTG